MIERAVHWTASYLGEPSEAEHVAEARQRLGRVLARLSAHRLTMRAEWRTHDTYAICGVELAWHEMTGGGRVEHDFVYDAEDDQ